jgi:hypothetical protein
MAFELILRLFSVWIAVICIRGNGFESRLRSQRRRPRSRYSSKHRWRQLTSTVSHYRFF